MVRLQQPLSTRAVLATTSMFVQANGESDEAEEPFFLPTNGTEGRVVRGTRCGGPNDSSVCSSNSPAPPPEPARIEDLTGTTQIAFFHAFTHVGCSEWCWLAVHAEAPGFRDSKLLPFHADTITNAVAS